MKQIHSQASHLGEINEEDIAHISEINEKKRLREMISTWFFFVKNEREVSWKEDRYVWIKYFSNGNAHNIHGLAIEMVKWVGAPLCVCLKIIYNKSIWHKYLHINNLAKWYLFMKATKLFLGAI